MRRSERRTWIPKDRGGHRCGRGNGDKLHLVAGVMGGVSWEQVGT